MKILLRAVAVMCSIGTSCFGFALMWVFTKMDAAEIVAVMCVILISSMFISLVTIDLMEERYDGEKK